MKRLLEISAALPWRLFGLDDLGLRLAPGLLLDGGEEGPGKGRGGGLGGSCLGCCVHVLVGVVVLSFV